MGRAIVKVGKVHVVKKEGKDNKGEGGLNYDGQSNKKMKNSNNKKQGK